jgi:hypothetical protein
MEATKSSETLVSCNIIWHYNPEDLDLNLHLLENLKSLISREAT